LLTKHDAEKPLSETQSNIHFRLKPDVIDFNPHFVLKTSSSNYNYRRALARHIKDTRAMGFSLNFTNIDT
jgi:hypothetical protein